MPTDVEINTIINTDRSNDGLTKLRKGLKDLISLQGQVGSESAQFTKLQKAINETENKIGDLNDSFQTLRGSGVERLNSSVGLLREGFITADPGKLSAGMKGLGAAMNAIPIFLLIQGLQLLYENFGKVIEFTKSLVGGFTEEEKALRKLNEQNEKRLITNTLLLNELGNEIALLKVKGASLDLILQKEQQQYDLQIENLKAKKAGLEATLEQQKAETNLTDVLIDQQTVLGVVLNTILGTNKKRKESYKETEKAIAETEANIQKLETERLVLTIKTNEEIARKREEEFEKRFKRNRELADRELAAQKQQDEELLRYVENERNKKLLEAEKKHQEEMNSVKNDIFLQSIERGRREFAIEQANLEKNLNGRIELIKRKRDEELAVLTAGSEAALIVEQNANEQIFQERLKAAQREIEIAKSVNSIISSLNQLQTQSENYELQQQKYQKDAAIQNDINRTQEALDRDEANKNKLLRNQNLTEKERERIIYNSETNQRNISERSKKDQLKLNSEYAQREIAIRKDQFERNKKLQLSMAIINTAAAIVSALATVQPTYPAGVIAAAGVGLAGGLQVAAIANTKFDDGGARAMSGVAPAANIDTRGGFSGSSSPSISSNQPSGLGPLGDKTNNPMEKTIKVVVLDSDIREVASKVDVLEDRATFGS